MRLTCLFAAALGLTITTGACSDGGGSNSADVTSATDTDTSGTRLRIFLTAVKYENGAGVAGADAHCMADDAKPATGTYKALIGGTSRRACTTADCAGGADALDWVLAPTTSYYRADGDTFLFTTNANAIFVGWPLPAQVIDGGGENQASGLDSTWVVRPDLHCQDWTTTDGRAAVGWTADLTSGLLQGGDLSCAGQRLLCVEQP